MKVWTDKNGQKLTAREFMIRWKEGIQKVTPLQQLKVSLYGYLIIFAGIIWGIGISLSLKMWWLFIILIGSLLISGVQGLGTLQKYFIISKIEKEVINGIKKDC